jgi:hypothetical protein
MPDTDTEISSLLDMIGLSLTDNAVYHYVVAHPDSTVEEVSAATRRTHAEVSRSQEALVDLGLVYADPVGHFKPVSNGPALLAEHIRHEVEADYTRKRSGLARLHHEMVQLMDEHMSARSPWSRPYVELMSGPEQEDRRLADLVNSARHEIARIRMACPELPAFRGSGSQTPRDSRALKQGVAVRGIYPTYCLAVPAARTTLLGSVHSGVHLRTVGSPPLDLTLLDRSVGVVTTRKSASAVSSTVLVRGRELLDPLCILFDTWWSIAGDVPRPGADEPGSAQDLGEGVGELGFDDRVLLKLMGEGYKDAQVARQIGVSIRTLRRRVSEVLWRLKADSRFQAGMLAARRGWV